MKMTEKARALRIPVARPSATAQVLCFPHAGGSAAYFTAWAHQLPADIELVSVQYPGRGDRFGEQPHTSMSGLVDEMYTAARSLRQELFLFGHSMGGAVAYEVAQRMNSDQGSLRALLVSGREAPHLAHHDDIHRRSDTALLEELTRLGGTPQELLESAEFAATYLPMMRADYSVIETYQPTLGTPLTCPITVFTGSDDPEVSIDEARAWQLHTQSACTVTAYPGSHFFHDAHLESIIDQIIATVDQARSPRHVVTTHPAQR